MTTNKAAEPGDAAVVVARKQAVARIAQEIADSRLNNRINGRRLMDPDDPFNPDEVEIASQQEEQDEKEKRATRVAELNGTTLKKVVDIAEADKERRTNLRQQLSEWRRLRKVHQDFLDNPEAYGGVDLSGEPLDPEEQLAHVKAYDAAISELTALLT